LVQRIGDDNHDSQCGKHHPASPLVHAPMDSPYAKG
jgi:hypothetical protein